MSTATAPLTAEWSVWSTTARVVVDGPPPALGRARGAVQQVLHAMDLAASRFRDDSDLSRVNAAAGRTVAVGELLAETLDVALHAAARSRGTVDPTLGRQLVALGYATDFSLAGTFRPLADQPPAAAGRWRDVELDRAAGTVRIPADVQLDLGAVAKAHAADLAADAAHRSTGLPVLVSLGGDLAVRGRAPGAGWVVRVAEAPTGAGALVHVEAGGLATSTTTLRRWGHAGRSYHHLLDPATGRPVSGTWRTASVAAATCVEANTATTAALVLGAGAHDWLEAHGLPARLVSTDGRVQVVGGWPADEVVA